MQYKLFFSPTGGTRRVLDAFAGGWQGDFQEIDLCEREGGFHRAFTAGDVCLVAVPSYGGRVPGAAVQRLSQMTGGGASAVLLCVYGNRAFEDTLVELSDVLTQAGFRCRAAVAAIAEHSIAHQYAAGRPDAEDCAELRAFAAKIRAGWRDAPVSLPGNRPYKAYHAIPMPPKAGKDCNGCGLCAAKCPIGAIDPADPRKTGDTCISCMRCIAVCPRGARKLNPVKQAAVSAMLKPLASDRKKNELFL